jgi:hypothetical protein
MTCEKCEQFEKEGNIYYLRFGNKEIGWINLGLICCEEHFKLAREKLLK